MYLRHFSKYMFGNLLIGIPQYILVNLLVHSHYVSDLLGGLNIIDLNNNLKINSTGFIDSHYFITNVFFEIHERIFVDLLIDYNSRIYITTNQSIFEFVV